MPLRNTPRAIVALLLFASQAEATERRFAFTYETTTSPKGQLELENWVTWQHIDATGANDADLFQFRHELEYGLTDNFQAAVYFFDWRYDEHDREGHKGEWEHSGAEFIYSLTNPTIDFLGSAIYLEFLFGERSLQIEGKILLQKNLGPVTVAYNAILEAEWEGEKFGEFDERSGEFGQVLGVSCDLNKTFSVGAELLHEIGLPEWEETSDSVVYAGPNASIRFSRGFITATALFQLTGVDSEPDAQVRVLTGFHF